MLRFLIHNFEKRNDPSLNGAARKPVLPCTDWIDVECIACGASWIAQPGTGHGTYACVGSCEGLTIVCRNCQQVGQVPVPRVQAHIER